MEFDIASLPIDEELAIRFLAERFFASGDDFDEDEIRFIQLCMDTLRPL